MSDLFGVLFLFLIEKETVQDATEENRFSAQDAIVDHQPHAFCCFQGMGLRLVLFYRSDGETPSFPASVRNRFPPTIEPYVRSCYAFVDLNTTVLIPRSLSQCNLLGVGDAGGCLRLPENEANGLAPRDRNASASDMSQPDAREASPHELCGVPSSDAG